jgi:hypothetical protein
MAKIFNICAGILAVGALLAGSASAAVGVEKASRRAGAPGDRVTLTLACGFCFPPCRGPEGNRHPEGYERGPCMLGTDRKPPGWFGVSLVPRSDAPAPHRCGPDALCAPAAIRPPGADPYTYLGRAVPPPRGNSPEAENPPRYVLRFEIPELRPGAYAYVIWCDACRGGRRGSLIASPASPLWRLLVD